MSPIVSFIVPLFNHVEHSKAMLASLQASLPPGLMHEIILVDDASTDGTCDWLQTLCSASMRVVLNPMNVGFARANHAGVALATGDVLALVNNDLIFSPGWLEPMLALLQNRQLGAGVVGNVQTRVVDGAVDHAGVQVDALGHVTHVQALPHAATAYSHVFAVTGACLLVRRDVFEAAGGFDEGFVNGCEDIDLCFRVRASGNSIYVANTSCIQHHVSLSRGTESLQNVRNSRYLFSRWRKTIKQELMAVWRKLLQSGPKACAEWISGELTPALLATPHSAAMVIAEAMLQREEHSWIHQLGEPDPNDGLAQHCSTMGLNYTHALEGYAWRQGASVAFEGLRSARNFYVAGRSLLDCAKSPIAISIRVNAVQQKTWLLAEGFNFNVGIAYPILLQGQANRFYFEAHFVDAQGVRLADASAALLITHVVVDDQVLADL